MLLEILLFLYSFLVIPYHKLMDAYSRYFLCELLVENDTIIIRIGNERMKTDYNRCSMGKGFQYKGEWFSNDNKQPVVMLELPEDF